MVSKRTERNGTGMVLSAYVTASNSGTQLVARPLQFALVRGVTKGSNGNLLDLGTYGTTTLDEVRQNQINTHTYQESSRNAFSSG